MLFVALRLFAGDLPTRRIDLDTMKAVTVTTFKDGSRKIHFDENYPKSEPGEGEVLLKVIMAGICGTDLEIIHGYKDIPNSFILGHEFVARIEKFGPHCEGYSSSFHINQRVVAEINCVSCRNQTSRNAAERAQDPTRTALGIFGKNGAFADFVTVPIKNLHPVPDCITDLSAVFVEPVAAACQILEQVQISGTAKVAVIGAGKLGWIVSQVLSAFGKQVTVIWKKPKDNDMYKIRSEKYHKLAKSYDVSLMEINLEHVKEELLDSFDIIVDCTGHPSGLELSIKLIRPRGIIILKSTTASNLEAQDVSLTPVVIKEIQIIGSRCGPFSVALDLLERKKVNPELLVQEILPLDQADIAFDYAANPTIIKCLLKVT